MNRAERRAFRRVFGYEPPAGASLVAGSQAAGYLEVCLDGCCQPQASS